MNELKSIYLSYGDRVIFENLTHTFAEGKITALMGASGIGKTTLLRMLAGLAKPDKGQVNSERPVAYLFQEPRLCPWLTAEENIKLVLDGKTSSECAKKWLSLVHLENDAKKRPNELSGGMCRRVALARTLCFAEEKKCRLILLDEPFSGLDSGLHDEMLDLIRTTTSGKTVVLSTHDKLDRDKLADEIFSLDNLI